MQNQESHSSISGDAESCSKNGSRDSDNPSRDEHNATQPASETNEQLLARLNQIRNNRKRARNQNSTLTELAQRGELRALGPLLEIMDVRLYTGGGWGNNRPVYIGVISQLLSHVGPDEFQSLTDAQIHQLTPLLCMPAPELYEAAEAALMRPGDARALRRMLRLTKFQKT